MLALLAYLIYLAYPIVPLYAGWTLARRLRGRGAYQPWIARLSARGRRGVRIAATVAAVLTGLGSALLTVSPRGFGALAAAPAVAVAGSVAYLAGVLSWTGRTAYVLRLAGWLAMLVPAAVPSQLTLVLPLVAPLVATVHPVPGHEPRVAVHGQPDSRQPGEGV